MPDLNEITWPCMVCGDERPDAAISVAHRSLAVFNDLPAGYERPHFNVRYCNDRPDCAAYANAAGDWTGPPGRRRRDAGVSRRGRRRPDSDEQLDEVYARVPQPGCQGLCQDSCGSVAMTPIEQARIAVRHGITLPLLAAPSVTTERTALGLTGACAALDGSGRCSVYVDRPLVCRLWGAVQQMACPYGCRPPGGFLPPHAARLAMTKVRELSERVTGRGV